MITKVRKHRCWGLLDRAGYMNHWAPVFPLIPNNGLLLIAHRACALHVTNPRILWDILGVLQ